MIFRASLFIPYTLDKKILMQDRRTISKLGEEWGWFGGHLNEGETPEEALVREVREELGYELTRYDYLGEIKSDNRDFRGYVFVAPFPGFDKVTLGEGDGMELFTIEEARKLKSFENAYKVIDRVEAYFRSL